jgi:N-acetylneuraminate synthase
MDNLKIGSKTITNSSATYFIADIAANHDGDLARAKMLIKLAKAAGADAAKFQHFKADKIVSDKGFRELGRKLDHQASWGKSVFEVYADASVPDNWTEELHQACVDNDIEFMSTPYDFAAVDLLDNYVSAFKIGSGDITWIEAIKYIGEKKKPIIIATGASEIKEVERAVKAIEETGVPYCLMQCNTNYTGDSSNINFSNLNVLTEFKKRFPKAILGLSDHTHGHVATLGAVALGARVIEKHFTDDVARVGPDHKFSMTPTTWSEMVLATRDLEKALGDGVKRIEDNESQTVIVQRRSVRAAKPLKAGQTITRSDLALLRPCPAEAVEASDLASVLGKVLVVDKDFDDQISHKDLK